MSLPVPYDASHPSPPRRFVTAHDENGKARFKYEGEIPRTATSEESSKKALFAVRHRPVAVCFATKLKFS